MGSSMKREFGHIEDLAEVKEYRELHYKLFQLQDYKVRDSNDEDAYTHLLQHAMRVAEGSISGKQRAKHSAMARYLAVDFATEVNIVVSTSRSKSDKREKAARDKIRELEKQMNEMRDEMNALIIKERSSNDELQRVRTELLKVMSEIPRGILPIGIKKIGELDLDVFIDIMTSRMSPGSGNINIVIKAVELCSLWQDKIKDPHWYPFHIIEDNKGKPQRMLKEDDITLQALKEEWGEEIHNVVVEALTDLQEHNPSGCYMVPEMWNFKEKRKAALDEVIRHISKKAKSGSESEETLSSKG